jgi:hypothetical protein
VSRSQLKPVVEVAQMLKRHLDNLLTYLKHHITNAKHAVRVKREAATILSRANGLNGGTRRHIVFSAENRCVATSCDYRGVPDFRTLKIQCESKVTGPMYIVANRYSWEHGYIKNTQSGLQT